MRRAAPRRSFKLEFRKYLKQLKGWPEKKLIEDWARKELGSAWGSGTYSDARNGRPIAEEHILIFVRYAQLANEPNDYVRVIRQVWNQYVLEKSGTTLSAVTDGEALHRLCDPPRPVSRLTKSREFILGGTRLIADFIKLTTRPRRFLEICPKKDIELAIRWVYIEVGRRNTRCDLPMDQAVAAAEEVINCPIEKYIQRAREWHAFEESTIVFASDQRIRIGVCIVLPVNEAVYNDIKSGSMPSYDCRAQHLLPRSPQLIVEALTMRPGELQTAVSEPTRCMLIALASQQAHLTDVAGIASRVPMRMLAPGGTPENCERLIAFGYKKTNTKMAGTGVDLYERSFYLPEGKRFDYALAVQWWGLQRLLRKSDPQQP